jgi:hypothetical protein
MRSILIISLALTGFAASSATPFLRVVKSGPETLLLNQNVGFEDSADGKLPGWNPAPQGFSIGLGRSGTQGLHCSNPAETNWTGASQTLVLNRTNILPLLIRGWSKAQNVSPGADGGYSLYTDLHYADGTPLWGQTANFHAGTHDWEFREILILPEKPVRDLTIHCLFRGRSGKAWFDDVEVRELHAKGDAVLFQGAAVEPVINQPRAISGNPRNYKTGDGFEVGIRGSSVVHFKAGGKDLAAGMPGGFFARDVQANSDFLAFDAGGRCAELGLKLQFSCSAFSNHIAIDGRLSDVRGQDRAITLVFALPLDAAGWSWGEDIRHSETISGTGDYANITKVGCGATGGLARYPLGAVYSHSTGVALGIDMGRGALYRVGYQAGVRVLYAAYDFGLVPEAMNGSASFGFSVFAFDPVEGFRSAFGRFMEVYPEHFRLRSKDQGIWMPFTDISTVEKWEDFGFKYHEGNNNVAWDDEHGVLSFRYTEPMTWWMRMAPGTPRTVEAALRVREQIAAGPDQDQRRMAKASAIAEMRDETGQPCFTFRNEPWCNGAVWSLNPNPALPATLSGEALNGATVHWNPGIRKKLYGPEAPARLDGEYLDSLEGYVTADLNFRREHFRHSSVPLVFTYDTHRPALFKGLAVYEFTKWLSQDVHALGKLMFANGVPYRFAFLCPWLDVMGTETDWMRNGVYAPAGEGEMNFWRTMCGQKPFLLLMNTDFAAFKPELVEKYFQRALFFGMYPSMFSHNAADNPYWQNPKWYNRDRPLFLRYQPLIKRVAEAGWRPVTKARSSNPQVWIERFGPASTGEAYLTLFNPTRQPQSTVVQVGDRLLGGGADLTARELLTTRKLADGARWPMDLAPESAAVIELGLR